MEGNNWMDHYGEFITRLQQVEDGVITVTSPVPGQEEILAYNDESGFRLYMLDQELGDNYEVMVIRIPSALYDSEAEFSRKLWAIHALLNQFKPWVMWNDDSSRLTIARPLPSRKWGVWDQLKIEKNKPKLPKRLNVLSQPTAVHGRFEETIIIPVDEHDEPHGDDVLTIKYLPNGDDAVMNMAIDGKFRVRRSVMNRLIDAYEERTGNTAQAERFRKKDRWNSRWLFELFGKPVLGKGDHIVCADELMSADIEISEDNVKDELGSTGNHTLCQMFPQEQKDSARSDRQAISNFSTSALTPEILKQALFDEVTETIERFKEGYLPFDIPDSDIDERGRQIIGAPLRAVFNKLNAVFQLGGTMNDSPHLMMMGAGQVSKMMGDMKNLTEADHDRKFPIPNARRVSLGNVLDIEWSRGKKVHLKDNVAFVDPKLGLIMNLATYFKVAPVLGGADGDDHIVDIEMIAGFSDDFFGFIGGDVIRFVYRPPIGNGSDGVRVGSEFWIFKAKNQTPANYMDLNVLESRPVCVAELDEVDYTWFGGDKDLEADGYTSRQGWKNFVAATEVTGSFGLYCNLLMVMVLHQIGFIPDAPMETYVDEAQQRMSKSGMAHIAKMTAIMKEIIENSGVLLDPYEAIRIGSEMPTAPGLFTELVNFHVGQQRRFLNEAKQHIIERTLQLKEENRGAKVKWMVNRSGFSKPGVIDMINEAEKLFRLKQGRKPSRHMDFEKIGTYVVNWMTQLINAGVTISVADEEGIWTHEAFEEHLREAWKWSLADANVNLESTNIENTVRCNDRRLLMGSLLDCTIKALGDR